MHPNPCFTTHKSVANEAVRQKMKSFLPILILAMLSVVSCEKNKHRMAAAVPPSDSHREAVAKFQGAQNRFKELIAAVSDEKGFDAAKPELDKIVSAWREVSATLSQLQPPADKQQVEFRNLIAEGHRNTEPAGEDMLRLMSINSREAQVTKWLEEFAEAGAEAGVEMTRLYGTTDYGAESAKDPKIDLSNAAVRIQDPLTEPAGGDKPQPEAKDLR